MAYTLAEIIVATRDLLNEDTASFFTDAAITRWIVQATLDISTVAKCVEAKTEIGVTLSQWSYALPTDSVEAFHVVWDLTKQGLRKVTPTMVGENAPEVDGERPLTWFEWNRTLYINPVPDTQAAGNNIHVFYSKVTSDVTALNDAYQNLAITYATYRGKLRDKRFAEAATLYAEYANALGFRRIDIQRRPPQTEADLLLATNTLQEG